MAIQNLTQTIEQRLDTARKAVEDKLFKEWKNTTNEEDREAIFAKVDALGDLVFTFKKQLKDINNG